MKQGLGMRLEAMIGFQKDDDPFVTAFDKVLGKIREKIKSGYYDFEVTRDEDAKEAQDLINNRFKMNVNLVTDGMLAAVIPFYATDNNIFLKEYFRENGWLESEKDFFKGVDHTKGFIDLENAKMGGTFSKGKSTVYMNFNELMKNYRMMNREIIAVLLHEIGHTFYPLAHADQLDRTNLIFEQAKKELLNKNVDKREVVRRTLNKVLVGDRSKVAEDLCSDNPDVFTKAAITSLGEFSLQHQSNARYSNNNFEMMADNFAVRFGLGKSLVIGLEKLTPGGVRFGDIFRAIGETVGILVRIILLFGFITTLSQMTGGLFGKVLFTLLWFIVYGIAIATFFYVLVRTSGEDSRNMTYDDLVHRYKRIRMQLIADIKDRKMTKTDAAKAIESIDYIGKLIEKGRNWRTPLDFMFNTFNPADRRAKDSIERQQALEALINNDLFLASLKLQQFAH